MSGDNAEIAYHKGREARRAGKRADKHHYSASGGTAEAKAYVRVLNRAYAKGWSDEDATARHFGKH